MTIVIDFGEWHIESHWIEHGTVATATQSDVIFNLDRPGLLWGAYSVLSVNPATAALLGVLLTDAGVSINDTLLGTQFDSLQSSVRNDSGGNRVMRHLITLIVKK